MQFSRPLRRARPRADRRRDFDRTDSGLVEDAQEWVTVISNIVAGRPSRRRSGSDVEELYLAHRHELQRRCRLDASVCSTCIEVPEGPWRHLVLRHGGRRLRGVARGAPPRLSHCITLCCKHDSTRNRCRRAARRLPSRSYTPGGEEPGAVHPLIRTHPETGRKSLSSAAGRNAHIVGPAPSPESQALLDELWARGRPVGVYLDPEPGRPATW